jgi:hypothetical protein
MNAVNVVEQVRDANKKFYHAFEQYDIEAMEAIWSKADYVKCIHPGWNALIGWNAIRESWETSFRKAVVMRFTLRNVQIDSASGTSQLLC